MRITGTGHASMRIDTPAGGILCDPWVNPAYFASWFPFPDNSQLDWEALGNCDYLYVSHLHRDHFDAAHLTRFVSKDATVLLPEYPTSELEDQLREIGFRRFLATTSGEVHELDGGLKIMIQALTSPTDGPIGDSSLWVEYDGVRLLNQNDARPTDLMAFEALGHVHAHMLQFSGAIWYPMVYELPQAAKTAFGKQKRDRQMDRTMRYIDDLRASWVFPIAGPPCFLDEELWHLNDIFGDDGNIFPDQQAFIDHYESLGRTNGVILLPGSTATITADDCVTTHPVPSVADFFAKKADHLQAYAERQRPVIELAKRTWRHPEVDVLLGMKQRIEPLLAESIYLATGVGGPVRFDLVLDGDAVVDGDSVVDGDAVVDGVRGVEPPDGAVGQDGAGGAEGVEEAVESIVVDFPAKQVRRYAGEKVRYRFRTRRAYIEHLLAIDEVDWVNSLFLSCRFSAARIGQYNEFVYAFFKCLSEERLQYAEGWYAEQKPDAEDVRLGDWIVQRRCPHLKADLTRFGVIDGTTLTCQLHGWQYDLASGRCLTSAGHELRSRPADRDGEGGPTSDDRGVKSDDRGAATDDRGPEAGSPAVVSQPIAASAAPEATA